MSEHFTYIIYSQSKDIFYKGSTSNPIRRFWEHNNDLSRYTANKGPWTPVFLQTFSSKREALIKERQLKKSNRKYLKWLIQQDCNLLKTINVNT